MVSAKRHVIESNIPAAVADTDPFSGVGIKARREMEDITAWMQMQEDAEIELLTQELSNRTNRNMRRAYE